VENNIAEVRIVDILENKCVFSANVHIAVGDALMRALYRQHILHRQHFDDRAPAKYHCWLIAQGTVLLDFKSCDAITTNDEMMDDDIIPLVP